MLKVDRVLVPVDGSIPSKNAAKYAAYLTRHEETEILLLHVWGPIPMLVGGGAADDLRNELHEHSEKVLAEYKQMVEDCGAKAVTVSMEGNPSYKIIEVQKSHDCDLVVMGSRGLSSFEGVFLGSVANTVMSHAECPVLITRNLRTKYLKDACFA